MAHTTKDKEKPLNRMMRIEDSAGAYAKRDRPQKNHPKMDKRDLKGPANSTWPHKTQTACPTVHRPCAYSSSSSTWFS